MFTRRFFTLLMTRYGGRLAAERQSLSRFAPTVARIPAAIRPASLMRAKPFSTTTQPKAPQFRIDWRTIAAGIGAASIVTMLVKGMRASDTQRDVIGPSLIEGPEKHDDPLSSRIDTSDTTGDQVSGTLGYTLKGNREKCKEIISRVPSAFAIDGAAPETTPIAKLMRGNASAIGFSVIKDGGIDCIGTVGNLHAEIAGTESPALTNESIFEVASLSKPVVAYGTLHLLAKYKIDLDETIDSYLPTAIIQDFNTECVIDKVDTSEFFNQFRGKNITFRQLLEHSSGIYDPDRTLHLRPDEEWTSMQLLQHAELRSQGTWRYSNAGYSLLECLLENIAHKSFPDIMKEHVLNPLGMTHSTFSQSDEKLAALRNANRLVIGQELEQVFTEPFVYPRAGGGLKTTPEDYARFIQALIRAYNETSDNPIKQMFHEQDRSDEAGQPCHYGLGIHVDDSTDDPGFWHTGLNNGFSTLMHFFPKSGKGAVVLANHHEGSALDVAIVCSIDAAYEWNHPQFRPLSASSISEGAFSQYLGQYSLTFPDGGDTILLDIVQENHMLFLQLPFPTPTSPSFQVPLFQSPDDNGLISILSPPGSRGPMITIKIDQNNEAKRTLAVAMEGGKPLKAELIPAHKTSAPAWQFPLFQQPPSAPTLPLRPTAFDTTDETQETGEQGCVPKK